MSLPILFSPPTERTGQNRSAFLPTSCAAPAALPRQVRLPAAVLPPQLLSLARYASLRRPCSMRKATPRPATSWATACHDGDARSWQGEGTRSWQEMEVISIHAEDVKLFIFV